jgi:hypothetical protein
MRARLGLRERSASADRRARPARRVAPDGAAPGPALATGVELRFSSLEERTRHRRPAGEHEHEEKSRYGTHAMDLGSWERRVAVRSVVLRSPDRKAPIKETRKRASASYWPGLDRATVQSAGSRAK